MSGSKVGAAGRYVMGAFGFYRADPHPSEFDCLILNSYGTSIDRFSVNDNIVRQGLRLGRGKPIIVDEALEPLLLPRAGKAAYVVRGPVSGSLGGGVGTWGVVVEAHEYMERSGMTRALIVGQAHHVYRTALQAHKAGIQPVLVHGMPRQFDPQSKQLGTRSLVLWLAHELIGALKLKRDGQL